MTDTPDQNRTVPVKLVIALWLGWLAFAVWITLPAFRWELDYFHSPGPQFYRAVVILLAASPASLAAWHVIRRRGLWKYEFAWLAGLPVLACLVYEPAAAVIVATVSIVCFASGRRVRQLLQVDTNGPVEDIAVSTGIGLGMLHCALFVTGMLGGYFPAVFVSLLALMALCGWKEVPALRAAWRQCNDAWQRTPGLTQWPGTLLSSFAVVLEAAAIAFVLAPSLTFDVLKFHLPAVQYYAAQHALRVPPFLLYAYYPQSVETVMTLGYVLAGQAAAQVLPVLYFVLAILVLFRIGRSCGMDRFSALAGVLFAVSIPALHWTGGSGKNDFALAFFILSSLLAYLRWMEARHFGWILLGAFALAMGAGVKHIVLFAIPPVGLLYAYAASRQARPVLAMAKLLAVLAGFGLFWHVRTWWATGNPVYPSSTASAAEPAFGHNMPWDDVILRYVRLPWVMHFHGRGHFESVSDFPMGILLIAFAPVWLVAWKRLTKEGKVCLLFCGMYFLYWSYSISVIRYAIAPISIVFLLTGGLAVAVCRSAPRVVAAAALITGAYAFVFAACGIAINEINGPQIRYFSGHIDRQEYLREALLPYRALEFLQGVAQPGDSVFSYDNCAVAYSPIQDHFDCMLSESDDWSHVLSALAKQPYRFLMVPQAYVADVPGGWEPVYADSAFHVYRNQRLAP